jgi:CSLREA domain-containing protein
VALLAILVTAVAGVSAAAPGRLIKVTTAADVVDPTDGLCSLREAITAANTNTGSGAEPGECRSGSRRTDTVQVPAGTYALTLEGVNEDGNATGDLDILDDVVIAGAGSGPAGTVLDGAEMDRIIDVRAPKIVVAISGVTIKNGNLFDDAGGAILNITGSLTVTDSVLSDNTTGEGPGGAIANVSGTVKVTNTRFLRNSAGQGAGIVNDSGTVVVTRANFSRNTAFFSGGGIYNRFAEATATVTESTFTHNTGGYGGAIQNESGTLNLIKSTLSANRAAGGGAGLLNFDGTVNVVNSTIAGNSAQGDNGGGIFNVGGTLNVVNSTIAGNSVATDFQGGGVAVAEGTATLTNTILANNTGDNCFGPVVDGGNNISFPASDASCPETFSNGDPELGPLQSNGGPTQTMALGEGSAAIDAGDDAVCAAPASEGGAGGVDQRGVTRPQGPHCDIGSFERAS